MGREIKRVPANFSWPMEQIWKGYRNPYSMYSYACKDCLVDENNPYGDTAYGDGLTPEARAISDSFYNGERWCGKLTQEEVDLLIEKNRLWDLTHRYVDGKRGRVLDEDGTNHHPTAAEVNAWQNGPGLGHDGINRCYLIEYRRKQAGITEPYCPTCNGEGILYPSEELRIQAENFDDERDPTIGTVWTEPPTGEWWQVWETVSEGSPVTPAFATADELVDYLVDNGDIWSQNRRSRDPEHYDQPPSREEANRFVKGSGWVPSMSLSGQGMKSGISQA